MKLNVSFLTILSFVLLPMGIITISSVFFPTDPSIHAGSTPDEIASVGWIGILMVLASGACVWLENKLNEIGGGE